MTDKDEGREIAWLPLRDDATDPVEITADEYRRAQKCVNALASIEDPATYLEELREKITALEKENFSLAATQICGEPIFAEGGAVECSKLKAMMSGED